MNHFPLLKGWDVEKKFDVRGLVFCCKTVESASNIFKEHALKNAHEPNIKNELILLPDDVQNANLFSLFFRSPKRRHGQ
jgi:hypothetical protein